MNPMMAIGAGTKMLGGIMQANNAAGQYAGQAAAHDANAGILERQAADIRTTGARNEEQQRRDYRDFAGSQLAEIGESGLSSGGSLADIVAQSESRAELDALRMRKDYTSRAQATAYDAKVERMNSKLAKSMAKRTKIAGYIGALGGGAMDFASIPKK